MSAGAWAGTEAAAKAAWDAAKAAAGVWQTQRLFEYLSGRRGQRQGKEEFYGKGAGS